MASVDLEKIAQDLNRRFAMPLPEFYKRRIISGTMMTENLKTRLRNWYWIMPVSLR